jgi:hypothetical protein
MKFLELEFRELNGSIRRLFLSGYRYAILRINGNVKINSVWRSKKAATNYILKNHNYIPINLEIVDLADYVM